MRPKKSSTNLRATWVLRTRSAGAWNEPTLSAREWRSATEPALGAHGSWTCTKSSGATISASSIVRAMSIGGAGAIPLRPRANSNSPTPSTRTPPSGSNSACGISRADRISLRESRTSAGLARRGEQQNAVPAGRELVRHLSGERPDLVGVLERMRRDLGDGETVCHCAQHSQGARRARWASSAASAAAASSRVGAHCICHASPSAIATAWVASLRASSLGLAWASAPATTSTSAP